MKNIFTDTVQNIQKAVLILRSGGNVAIPTETVYGLAGIANNNNAISNIYALKNRPQFNPLIAHCCDLTMVKQIACVDDVAQNLLNHFNDGNLTIVLPVKQDSELSKLGCAGLDTVAVRIPTHKTTLEIIKRCEFPLFAPSANKSGGISPTKADHVYTSLGEKIDMIIDGGKCSSGIESTIVNLVGDIAILRNGVITKNELQQFLNTNIGEKTFSKGNNPVAPGQLKSHYKPDKKLFINVVNPNENQFYIGYGKYKSNMINLSCNGELLETASNLFDALYRADNSEFDEIAIAPIPNEGIGVAINDKLNRASAK